MASSPAQLTAIELASFKSYRGARLPLDAFTLLVGRNGSGKSNALDGLWVLSQLASGDDIRDALDGNREGPEVRGGVLGCVPPGESEFALGCSVRTSERLDLHYEVRISVEPVAQVRYERLWTTRLAGKRKGEDRDLLITDPADPERSDIVARWDNQNRGTNPPVDFRASQLVITQVASRVPSTSAAGREIHDLAGYVLAALRAVFVLDPVPHEMRQYVRRKDSKLRRNGENLSATIAALLTDRNDHARLLTLVQALSESRVVELDIAESPLEDVMLTLEEQLGVRRWPVPARQMSDGTLRFLALVAALLQTPREGHVDLTEPDPAGQTTLVIEELENGLHSSQAARIINLLRDEAGERDVRVLATTHSPALLDALPGDIHNSVVACWRDEQGWSQLGRLPELASYLRIVTSRKLGDAATANELRSDASAEVAPQDALQELFAAR